MPANPNDRFALIVSALIGALSTAHAAAQTLQEDEIVVTAPIEGSRIESLQGATVLAREDIIENLNGGLGDTLDAQPGVTTTFFGAGASRPVIRGLGEDRVRVLENGIGAIDASSASPDHAVTADGLDAHRIEVLRGAAALAYGGNAIGGVVNVIDESIPTRPANALSFEGFASASSVDEGRQGFGAVAGGAGPFAFRVGAAARETDDYETPLGEALNSWTSFRAYSAGGALVGERGFAGLAVKRTENEYGLPPEDPSDPGGHIELEQTRIEARGDARIDVGKFDRLDFGVQHSDYEHTEFEGDGAPGTRFVVEGWEGRVEAHHRGERLRGAVGLQYADADFAAEGAEAFITPSSTQDLGAFVVERWDAGTWGLEGGARVERREIDNLGGGGRSFDNTSASAGVFFRPVENWFLGATLARTQRAPTAIELFAEGPHLATANYEVGDPALDQETATSFEVSARHEAGRFRFEANAYRINFEDYVALVQRGDVFWLDEATETSGFAPDEADPSIPVGAEVLPVFVFTQQDAIFTGGEISARAQLFEAGGFRVSGDIGYDLVRAEFDAGGRPPRIPPHSLTIGFDVEDTHWRGRIEAVRVGQQDRLAAFETTTEAYTFLNAGIAFRPEGEGGALTLRLDGRNLTDEEGRVHASFLKDELPLPGRNVRFSVAASF